MNMNLAGRKITVVGLGATGAAAAQFLVKRGARVTVTDTARQEALGPVVKELHCKGVALELGEHRTETFTRADLVIISPGVPHTIAPVRMAADRGIPVIGEVELASRFIREPIIAITGTNGKTTTTELVGEMLAQSGVTTFVGGNIGSPLIGHVDSGKTVQVVVAEISSFQLDTIEGFRPAVAVLLNIAEDHLDRYPDFMAYARSKGRVFENQLEEDIAVLNGNDRRIEEIAKNIRSRRIYFQSESNRSHGLESVQGAVITPEGIRFQPRAADSGDNKDDGPGGAFSVNRSEIRLKGLHNHENAAAAGLAALSCGGTPEGVRRTLASFRGLPHRLELVATYAGVEYYNDSKATNMDAVARALQCFSTPVVLIMGGRNKQGDFSVLSDKVRGRVKHIVAIGEARSEVIAALGRLVPASIEPTMEDAVDKAAGIAATGEVVLLSPGCASFDMYENYARRGDDFRRAVEKRSANG